MSTLLVKSPVRGKRRPRNDIQNHLDDQVLSFYYKALRQKTLKKKKKKEIGHISFSLTHHPPQRGKVFIHLNSSQAQVRSVQHHELFSAMMGVEINFQAQDTAQPLLPG